MHLRNRNKAYVNHLGDLDLHGACVDHLGDMDLDEACIDHLGDMDLDRPCIDHLKYMDSDGECIDHLGDMDGECIDHIGDMDRTPGWQQDAQALELALVEAVQAMLAAVQAAGTNVLRVAQAGGIVVPAAVQVEGLAQAKSETAAQATGVLELVAAVQAAGVVELAVAGIGASSSSSSSRNIPDSADLLGPRTPQNGECYLQPQSQSIISSSEARETEAEQGQINNKPRTPTLKNPRPNSKPSDQAKYDIISPKSDDILSVRYILCISNNHGYH